MSKDDQDNHYKIGYGKPPKHGQFKPGQSGNPKGRPARRDSTIGELFQDGLNEIITVKENGATKRLAIKEVVVKRALAKLLDNKDKDFLRVYQQIEKLLPDQSVNEMPTTFTLDIGTPVIKQRIRDAEEKIAEESK